MELFRNNNIKWLSVHSWEVSKADTKISGGLMEDMLLFREKVLLFQRKLLPVVGGFSLSLFLYIFVIPCGR